MAGVVGCLAVGLPGCRAAELMPRAAECDAGVTFDAECDCSVTLVAGHAGLVGARQDLSVGVCDVLVGRWACDSQLFSARCRDRIGGDGNGIIGIRVRKAESSGNTTIKEVQVRDNENRRHPSTVPAEKMKLRFLVGIVLSTGYIIPKFRRNVCFAVFWRNSVDFGLKFVETLPCAR